jgi:WXG100 family type VII secretion target
VKERLDMSNDIIQADYDILETIAGRFAQQAEASQAMHDAVRRAVQALQKGGWESEGSSAFFAEMEGDIFPAVTRLTDALSEAQRVTLQVKETFQAAEEDAISKSLVDKNGHMLPYTVNLASLPNTGYSTSGIKDLIKKLATDIARAAKKAAEGLVPDNDFSVADKVPADGSVTRYPRGENGNCTWYVAEAIKTASHGKIDITADSFPNLGNASEWPTNAQKYINKNPDGIFTGIDNTPEAGAIAFVPPGHVAFVESAEKLPSGEWKVIFSDENWGGETKPYVGETNVETINLGDSKINRWRHTQVVSGFKNTQFIHIQY